MKTQIIIEIESKNVKKIASDIPDEQGDQVVDEQASQQFEQSIHRNIGVAIAGFVDDTDRLDEDVLESLSSDGYDLESLMSDPVLDNLQELGNIEVKVLWHKVKEAAN